MLIDRINSDLPSTKTSQRIFNGNSIEMDLQTKIEFENKK